MQNMTESLRRQREQILSDSSEEQLARHASLLDVALISLYNRTVNRIDVDTEKLRSGGALLGAGCFARGLIGPSQVVSLLFVKGESSPWQDTWLDEITGPLSQAGWLVKMTHGTVEALLNRASEDPEFFFGLVENRYISGNRQLCEELETRLESELEGRRESLLHVLFGSVQERATRLDDEHAWLEPDLEGNPGGLEEINAIRLACRIASNVTVLEDAIFRGYLTRQEVDFLQQAEKTFTRLLNLSRNLFLETDSVLSFDQQEVLAAKLGYGAPEGFLPVESFMQQVFRSFHGVLRISREFWERMHESRHHMEFSGAHEEELEGGISARAGKIRIRTDRYPASADRIVHLFHVAAKNGLGFDNVTRQWVEHHRNVLNTAAGNVRVKDELLEIIRSDAPNLPVFRNFYDLGLLSSLVPELDSVHGLVQHDAFHLYPVHEHHLRTLSEIKRLLSGDYSQLEPELTQLAQGISEPSILFLAALFHDIGKSAGRGHAARGAEMIPTIGSRLGLTPTETETLQFLVGEHLLLIDSAAMRDLADEEMLTHCANTIGSIDRLDPLALLSFADMAATGPKGLQKWRDTPVIPLYQRLHHLLERGEPSPEAIRDRIENIRNQVERELFELVGQSALEANLAHLAPRYLLSMPPSAIAKHLRMEWDLRRGDAPFVWEVESSDEVADLTLVSHERPGLVSRFSGALSLHGMNILGAQVFAMYDGVGVFIFRCRLPDPTVREVDWTAVVRDMRHILDGKMALSYRIAAHAASLSQGRAPARTVPTQILVDNESSGAYTILEVYTSDRVGLLYTITRVLFEMQLRIFVAKITTRVDQVADVFYVKTLQGEKVLDPERIEELKKALHFWLDTSPDCL
ncbi:MAG: HD domain-containing protein [Deltaproteobacteria bacterium]|nr:HD domain-containing protein [Deltaproteobacteria bacterium]